MEKVKLEILENDSGVDFFIQNPSEVDMLTLNKLKEFALKRSGYFLEHKAQFGIKRKLKEKQLKQIFELLEIESILIPSASFTDEHLADRVIEFGKYKGFTWRNVPLNYLEWLYTQNEDKLAYEEIKRRKSGAVDIENTSISIGKYKGQKWINVPSDYLNWILMKFESSHETYKFAQAVLNHRKSEKK